MRERGRPSSEVLAEIAERQAREPDVHGARLFGLVYPTGRADIESLLAEVSSRYLFGNALNPYRFPEVAAMEGDVVDAVAQLLHRSASERRGGALSSGGTESILMSMLVHRERARKKGIERAHIVAPSSAHPAYAKAAHYFDMELVSVPVDDNGRADLDATRRATSATTAVIVASAFNYPYGVMDPVADLAALAQEAGAGCHVDACIGGFVLPFLERLGHNVEPWDFRVPGVTSISADVHKYGYVPKGVSVLLHRDDDWFENQFFLYDQWGSGLYGSAGVAGARPAAPAMCAWAMFDYLGVEGYTQIMADLMNVVATVRRSLAEIPGIEIVGEPIGPVLAVTSRTLDLFVVGDAMAERGWFLNRNTAPRGLHLMLSPAHANVVDELLDDLHSSLPAAGVTSPSVARYS